MPIQEDRNTPCLIRSYEPGRITCDNQVYEQSIIIDKDQNVSMWRPESLNDITTNDWSYILSIKPDIILLGTGTNFRMPPPELLAPLYNAKIGVECMDTGAACRSYVALISEQRNVIAALLVKK